MGIEIIIGGIVAVLAAIFGAFKLGSWKGGVKATESARADRETENAKRAVESLEKSSQAQLNVAKESAKVNNEVSNLNDGDALRELRRDYSRD